MTLGSWAFGCQARRVVNDSKAELTLEDGNVGIRAQQEIPYTDFPLSEHITYACWDSE